MRTPGSRSPGRPSGGGGTSASASDSTAPTNCIPVAFGEILCNNDVPVHHPIPGRSKGCTTHCRFNETVVSGDIHYGFVASVTHSLAAAYFTPATGKVRILTADPESLEYATVEVDSDVPPPPGTEAPSPPAPTP